MPRFLHLLRRAREPNAPVVEVAPPLPVDAPSPGGAMDADGPVHAVPIEINAAVGDHAQPVLNGRLHTVFFFI